MSGAGSQSRMLLNVAEAFFISVAETLGDPAKLWNVTSLSPNAVLVDAMFRAMYGASSVC